MTTIARLNEDGSVLLRGELIEGSEYESFKSLPSDLIKSGSSVYIDTSTGSLRSDGGGSWWYLTGDRFRVNGDFEIEYELLIGSGGRDIANMAFYVNNAGQNSNGFAFRLQNESNDGGFFITTNGNHTPLSATVPSIKSNVWYRINLSCKNNVARAIVIEKSNGNLHSDTSCSLTFDSTHPKNGVFGQKHDGAGNSYGSRWRNIKMLLPVKFKYNTSGDLFVDEFIEGNGTIFKEDFNSLDYSRSSTTVNSIANSILNVTSTSGDPMINMFNIGHFDPKIYRYLLMKYRVVNGVNTNGCEFYFLSNLNAGLSETYKVAGYNALISDGNWHIAVIDCWTCAGWKNASDITGWRFDWSRNANVNMEIDYLKLVDNRNVVKQGIDKKFIIQDELIEGVSL